MTRPWLGNEMILSMDFPFYQLIGRKQNPENNQIFEYKVLVIFGYLEPRYSEHHPCQVSAQNTLWSYGFLWKWIIDIKLALQRKYAKYCLNDFGPIR